MSLATSCVAYVKFKHVLFLLRGVFWIIIIITIIIIIQNLYSAQIQAKLESDTRAHKVVQMLPCVMDHVLSE